MAEHKGQVEASSQNSHSRTSKATSPGNAGMAVNSPPTGAFALQRTFGNQALGSSDNRSGRAGGDFVGSLLQRVATIRPTSSPATIQRDPFFRSAPRISTNASSSVLQRFKDVKGGEELATADFEKATTEKLLQWQARDGVEGLDPELVPDSLDMMEIGVELEKRSRAEKEKAAQTAETEKQERIAKARQDLLANLGVTEPEYQEISRTTTNEKTITKVSLWCTAKKVTVLSALDAIKGFSGERRLMALEVFGKGEVESVDHVADLCANWHSLDDRDALDIAMLVRLLDGGALTAGGGTYRIPKLTGTMDMAIPFYSNGTVERRIDPEFHVHYTLKDGASNPGFKKQAHKKVTGPGTRRVVSQKECDAILKASGAL